jgi:hypothetical protein
VPVGDKLVDANASFKLYLVTRNASPQLTPDVLPLLTVTNFSITRSGLESEWLLWGAAAVNTVVLPPLFYLPTCKLNLRAQRTSSSLVVSTLAVVCNNNHSL